MAVEYFTKLLNQELPHAKIERDEDYGTFLRGLSQQEKLGSKITYSPVSDSEYPSDEDIVIMKYAVKINELMILSMMMKNGLRPL